MLVRKKINEKVMGSPTSRDTMKRSSTVFSFSLKEKDIEHLQNKADELNTLLMSILHLKNSEFVIEYIDVGLFITFNDLDEDDYCIAITLDRFDKIRVCSISKEEVLQEYYINYASTKDIAYTVARIVTDDNIL